MLHNLLNVSLILFMNEHMYTYCRYAQILSMKFGFTKASVLLFILLTSVWHTDRRESGCGVVVFKTKSVLMM